MVKGIGLQLGQIWRRDALDACALAMFENKISAQRYIIFFISTPIQLVD